MPYCPNCHYEFVAEAKICSECKVDLVDKLDGFGENNEEYVEIYMSSNHMETEVVKSLLANENVDVLIRDLQSFLVLPDFGRRAFLHIAVAKHHEQKARLLLKDALQDGALTEQGTNL